MLTVEMLDKLPHAIFDSGVGLIVHPEFNSVKKISEGGVLEEDGRHVKVRWVAKRGEIHDWAIYTSLSSNLIEAAGHDWKTWQGHIGYPKGLIAEMGQKLINSKDIRTLVPCSDEAFKLYRF